MKLNVFYIPVCYEILSTMKIYYEIRSKAIQIYHFIGNIFLSV